MTTQSLDLDAIEARAEAATPGPWTTDGWEIYQGTGDGAPDLMRWVGETCRADDYDGSRADAAFIAHAREDVPAMAAEIRRLRAELAEARTKTMVTEADEIVAHCPDHGSRDTVWINCYCADDLRRRAVTLPAPEETHVVADGSDDPEHVDDCPGCTAARPTT
jgi:hypothetical protein